MCTQVRVVMYAAPYVHDHAHCNVSNFKNIDKLQNRREDGGNLVSD